MGKLELSAAKQRRKDYIQRATLAAVGITGLLAVAMIAPNAVQILGKYSVIGKRFNERSRKAASKLISKGYLEPKNVQGEKFLQITPAGRRALDLMEVESLLVKKPRRWDHRWRLIVFDIPEKKKKTRDRLRLMLVGFGFARVQDSVWVFPYDCEEIVALLKAELQVGRDVLYAIVEKIENDEWLRKHFGLSG